VDRLDYLTTETERRIEILEFVKDRQRSGQNTTKASVIRHLKEKKLSSRETGLNLINDLIKEGKLNKKEINSQVHFLTINEENEFNRIFKELSEIELIILRMFDNYVIVHEKKVEEKVPRKGPFGSVNSILTVYYPMVIDTMLHILLIRIKKKIDQEIDKEILYPEIITLMDVMDRVPTSIRGLELFEEYTQYMKKLINKNLIKDYAVDMGIKLSVVNELLSKTENFKKEFLTEFGRKSENPREKSH
jgi:hypothetical protein